jgi:hypothetical protein
VRELLRRSSVLAACLLFFSPSLANAIEFVSDFDFEDFATEWLHEEGSDVVDNGGSIILSAAAVSPKERGRILIRPILATTPEEISTLTFIVDAPEVSAPFAARAFYYDENRNYLGSDPLFGTLEAGRVIALGSVLNPGANVRGLRVRLYSNAPTGSVTLDRLEITKSLPPVPEPSTTILMGLGLAGLASVRPHKR